MKRTTRSDAGRPRDLPRTVAWPLPPPGRPRYSWLLRTGFRLWLLRRLLRRALPLLPPAGTVLDLGAGSGTDLEELRLLWGEGRDARSVLVEAQREMLGPLRDLAAGSPATHVVRADVTRLPFRDASASVVLSIGMLCCVAEESVADAVGESARVLAPGGILVLGVPRWRGRRDEASTTASGLVRRAGGRPGHAVFQKPLYRAAPLDP